MMDCENSNVFDMEKLKIILAYYSSHPPPWVENSSSKAKMKKSDDKDITIVEEVLQLLTLSAKSFRRIWNWFEFANLYLNHHNTYVTWLACQCIAILLQLTESEKNEFVNCFMDREISIEHMLNYNLKSKLNSKNYLNFILPNEYNFTEGMALPQVGCARQFDDDLILVNSTKRYIKNLSLAVSVGKAVCLIGPVGCGKTALVHYLANITGHTDDNLFTVQLSDETNSKMLLGSYHCTNIPGEFKWQPGVLTKAVIEGKWLLLENLDSASSDVATVLVSLLKSRSLSIPGFRDQINPAAGFQLFLTQRVNNMSYIDYCQKKNLAMDLLGKHCIQINVEPLNKSELIAVVESKFSKLKTIAPRIIDVFLLLSVEIYNNDNDLTLIYDERVTSTRDLMKWCARIIKEYNVTSNESTLKVIQDAVNIFCCSSENPNTRLYFVKHIASLIGFDALEACEFLSDYTPTIILEETRCIAGRITLPHTGSFLDEIYTSSCKFALTQSHSCLLEHIALSIDMQEPVLLIGETGTGKTSTIQFLAKHTGNKIIVLNMNQQIDSVDLIGGYKPVEMKTIIKPVREQFESLFRADFDVEKNIKFLCFILTCFNKREWTKLIMLMKHVFVKAVKKNVMNNKSIASWIDLNKNICNLEVQLKHFKTTMAFAFVEGSLIQAVKEGYWVLLEEINLASAKTLQCLSTLLESNGTVTIHERTVSKPIYRHPNFRLMATMNPAPEFDNEDLPPGIRNRFTEFFVDELTDDYELITLTACYLSDIPDEQLYAVSEFYLIAIREAEQVLVDGTGHKPYYSLRTYCRALSIASSNPCQSAQRSLYESFCLSFLTQLDSSSYTRVESLIADTIFDKNDIQGVINQPIPMPINKIGSYVQFEGYWIEKGTLEPSTTHKYILTESVKKNLRNLVRAVSLSSFPILIQGNTRVGKTSLITYLAATSGNVLVRVNNHKHTNLQEYIGSYSAQSVTGQLVFKEGVMVEAMRMGHWIVLDELNLAPTDVLKALKCVLDDNRELFIPETQTIVKAHPGFRLFATQNSPGLSDRRIILPREFKNRFIEIYFNDIPQNELEIILFKRCEMPLTYAKKVVSIMCDLQIKYSSITLRDLFRWGERYRLAYVPDNYNWNQHLVDEGFLVLYSKVKEEKIILRILEKHFECSLLLDRLFTLNENTSPVTRHILEKIQKLPNVFEHIYLSKNIIRMVVLSCRAIEFNEPILLIGETGCGLTTVCQIIAAISKKKLLTVNCHQHTESSDFLGELRPVRNQEFDNDQRLFEWVDGPLVEALIGGHIFLADEISLADDSVLERFTSLFKPERKLLLSESIKVVDDEYELVAHSEFCFIGTMKTDADYDNEELLPALRNQLTEIWCESYTDDVDLVEIINNNFSTFNSYTLFLSQSMVEFVNWIKRTKNMKDYLMLDISIRDYLTWIKFIESMMNQLPKDDVNYNSVSTFFTLYKEGAIMTFLDKKIEKNPSYDKAIEKALINSLNKYVPKTIALENGVVFNDLATIFPLKCQRNWFGFNGYYIHKGNLSGDSVPEFSFDAPITKENVIRLLRCMQIDNRAILVNGNSGVGKTSLIQAVSKASGHKLTHINLSEQTDVSDLFGADLPTDGGDGGSFEWRDGPFLRALKEGNWILLDELNLASQSVLEALNAVLDHRGELYITELGRKFTIESKKTRLFACQNPMSEGGERKRLPKSFLNRFLQVHLNLLNCCNIMEIIHNIYKSNISKLQSLNLNYALSFCKENQVDIRDMLRWVDVTLTFQCDFVDHLPLIFMNRCLSLYNIKTYKFFGMRNKRISEKHQKFEFLKIFPSGIMFNRIVLPRNRAVDSPIDESNNKLILRSQIHILNSLAVCMKMNWMPILVGNGSGKTSVVKTFAQLLGRELHVLSVNTATDITEILGGFERADFDRHLAEIAKKIEKAMYIKVGQQLLKGQKDYISLLGLWYNYRRMTDTINDSVTTMVPESKSFKQRIIILKQITNALHDLDLSNLLQYLTEQISFSNNLHSSGKFEWIDSILVKCLIDGSWLLIENVNLCSPTVLDRLNGLLEPNGVLELGEKGIGCNGEIPSIKPHKDFRIFLTMDPKHGSISNTLKNRGVEIYMGPLDEMNNHDIHSMLQFQGINDHTVRHTLINIHTIIRSRFYDIDVDINHLIRVAYLVSQNIKRGELVVPTIREICTNTYVDGLFENLKEGVIFEINSILEKYPITINKFWCYNIETKDILQSSSLSYIKQQCDILEQHKHLININKEDLLLCYFGRSSSSDISIRIKWLTMHLNLTDKIKDFVKRLSNLKFDALNFLTKSIDHIDHDDLPYDYRYLPDVFVKNKYPIDKTTPCAENKIHLILDHVLNQVLDQNVNRSKEQIKRLMILDGGIFHDYVTLSNTFDSFIDYYIAENSLTINKCDCLLFKKMTLWIRKIEKKLFTNFKKKDKEYKIVLIHSYFSIIVEHFIPMMESITLNEIHPFMDQLKTMKSQILKNYLKPKRNADLNELLVQKLNIPLHQCCKQHGDQNIDIFKKNIDLANTIKSNNVQAVITNDIINQREKLLMYEYNNCKEVRNNFEEYKKIKMNNMEINLIPLWELIIERNFLTQINYDSINIDTQTNNKHFSFMKSLLQFIPTASPFYYLSLKTKNSFSAEYLVEALQHSINSIAVENPSVFLKWLPDKNIVLEKNDDSINDDVLYYFEQPLFTVFITDILLKKTDPYYTFSPRPIRLLHNNSHNLSCIKSFIWNSSKLTSDIQFKNIEALINLVELFFSTLLPDDILSLEHLHLSKNNKTNWYSVTQKFNSHETMINAIYDTAKEVSQLKINLCIYRQKEYSSEVERNNLIREIQLSVGRLWVLSGMCLLEVFSAVSTVDPLQKAKVRIQCSEYEKNKLKSRLHAEKIFCEVEGISELFPFKNHYVKRLNVLKKDNKNAGYRPNPPLYNNILEDITRFSKMYGLDSNTYNMINLNITDFEVLVNEMNIWLSSVSNFYNSLNEHYAAYPDMLCGILLSINQMRYGIRMLKNHYKWAVNRNENVTSEVVELLTLYGEFPRFCPNIVNMTNMDEIISMNISDKFRWYKLCLEELNNMMYLSGQSCKTDQYINIIGYILEKFVYNWKRLQEEEENKKRDEESLYKQKSLCEITSLEIEIAQGAARQFPTTKYLDFENIESSINTLDNDITHNSINEDLYNLTDKDINDICRLHTELVRPAAVAHWLPIYKVQFDQNEAMFRLKSSFSDRFCLFGKLLMSKFMYLDFTMDDKMIPWLLVATDIANSPKNVDNKGYYDFYRDSNVEYAIKTYDILKIVEDHIEKLLDDWPEDPTLQSILKVVDRIMNFDWSSPTCRFLIGLELLLTNLHEWEEVAHRGISVQELTLMVTHCIEEYRSLELSTWKECLKTSHKKIQNNSLKWWFHLYSIFESYRYKEEPFEHLVNAIQKFMESSSLGQFVARLELLYTFHCDVVCREKSKEQIELCNVSWNLYKYYSQFKDCINHQIDTLSADLKKKLQDFIKTVKWNDINYWSMKETVTKVQQTLHKYTREYEEILSKSVSFAIMTQSTISKTKTDQYILPIFKISNYLEKCEIFLNLESSKTVNMLNNLKKYSNKLFSISDKIITNCSYSTHVTELNEFINGIMETAQELRDLNIDSEASKHKQKSQAKQILKQNRKALTELFKALQGIGLSYKAGLMGCKQMDYSVEFAHLPPIDIIAALELLTPKDIDDDLRLAWSDCELYFFKSVFQNTALKIASETPKLGQQEMDRIKGFVNDLRNVTWTTKNVLASNIESLIKFRSMLYLSDSITDSNSIMFNPSDDFQKPINYMINSINILHQFKVAVQSYNDNVSSIPTDSIMSLLDDFTTKGQINKPSEIIANIDDIINSTQNTLNSIIDKKTDNAMKTCNINFIVREKYDAAVVVCTKLKEYIKMFYTNIWINECNTIDQHNFEPKPFISNANEVQLEEIDSLINHVLESVEKLYRRHTKIKSENENDKLLKHLILLPLTSDLDDINLVSINKQFENILKSSIGDNLLKSCRPLFEQYLLLVQYFVTHQTIVYRVLSKMNYLLSTLFTDLASNGYCVPDELLDGEEDTQSDGKNCIGLTEGEGFKDVSDQIESHDQLEDAKKDYNDDPEPEKYLEEEKSVEMLDDFDGKLHDMDKNDTKISDSEENDNDQDKKMGETGEDSDTLDEKLWGSDSDDESGDEQEDQPLKVEDGKSGETIGDKELGAEKDENNAEEQDKKGEIVKKNYMKDINEMDYDGEESGKDHRNPHHGGLQPPPEPKPMYLPNDLQLDDGEMNDNEETENNPFDIDAKKEKIENSEKYDEEPDEKSEDDINNLEDTSDEDEINNENKSEGIKADSDEELDEENKDNMDNGGKKNENKTGGESKEEDIKRDVVEAKPSED